MSNGTVQKRDFVIWVVQTACQQLLVVRERDEHNEVGEGGGQHGGQGLPLHGEEAEPVEGGATVDPSYQLLHPQHLSATARGSPSNH